MSRLIYRYFQNRSLSQVTPFTYKDGVTYLALLRELMEKVGELVELSTAMGLELGDLSSHINTQFKTIVDQFTRQLDNLDPDQVRFLVADLETTVTALEQSVADAETALQQSFDAYKIQIDGRIASQDQSIAAFDSVIESNHSDVLQRIQGVLDTLGNDLSGVLARVATEMGTQANNALRTATTSLIRDVMADHPVIVNARNGLAQHGSFRVVGLGDSQMNDGSLEVYNNGARKVWGGYGWFYRLAAMCTAEGVGESQAGINVYKNVQPGSHWWEAANAGNRGDSFGVVGNLENLRTIDPNLVFIGIGTNDYLAQRNPGTFQNELDQVVTFITQNTGAGVIMFSGWPVVRIPNETHSWAAYINAMKRVVDNHSQRAYFADFNTMLNRIGSPNIPRRTESWLPDGIHGNRQLHKMIADKFAELLGLPDFSSMCAWRTFESEFINSGPIMATPAAYVRLHRAPVPREAIVYLTGVFAVANELGEADLELKVSLHNPVTGSQIESTQLIHVRNGSLESQDYHKRTGLIPANYNCDITLYDPKATDASKATITIRTDLGPYTDFFASGGYV